MASPKFSMPYSSRCSSRKRPPPPRFARAFSRPLVRPPLEPDPQPAGVEPARASRLGPELLQTRGRCALLQLSLQPQSVEPDEIAHRATLAVHEAVDQLHARLPGPGHDA